MPIAAALRPVTDRRAHRRHQVSLDASLKSAGQVFDCVIVDVSAGGAQLVVNLPAEIATMRLEIEAYDGFDCRVVWRNEACVRIEFQHEPVEVARRLAALLGSSR